MADYSCRYNSLKMSPFSNGEVGALQQNMPWSRVPPQNSSQFCSTVQSSEMHWNFAADATRATSPGSGSWGPHGDSSSDEVPLDYDGLVLRDIIPSGCKLTREQAKKTQHKYTPHSEKPTHVVARRNARERRRVETINGAFVKLRKHIPYENKSKRLSKFKTLKTAIEYIAYLQDLVYDCDSTPSSFPPCQHVPHAQTTSWRPTGNAEAKAFAQMGNLQWLQQHFLSSMKTVQRRRCSETRIGQAH